MMQKLLKISCATVLAVVASGPVRAASVDFAKDVFPILQRSCFECHDAKLQKGKLRLDTRELAFKNPEVVVKGDAAKSELYRRIILPKGHDDVMPNRGEPLSKAEVARIKAWIDAGAVWPDDVKAGKHWAYVQPSRPAARQVQGSKLKSQNPIDAFILARLQKEGLKPSPEAERATLIRRVSLDLIGLPPSPSETDAFVNDKDPRAYEKLVDRLLASDQFGVRWARPWLDYARYADSHGFQRDDIRDLWPYRDWVVNALNADMPFTQFTIEQLAGDLLPNATEAQKIATGFNRSAPTNVEAGTDPEETRVNQIHDRVNTLGMVWLGSTLECCQCHDHKYDPFSQRDYYGIFAFFNNTALEADRTNPKTPGSIQFKGPTMELADAAIQSGRQQIQSQLAEVNKQLAARENAATAGQSDWEAALGKKVAESPKEHVLEIADFDSTGGATHEILPDKSVLISGEPAPDKDTYVFEVRTKLTGIRAIKLETLVDDSLPGKGPGRGDEKRPNFVLNNFIVTAASAGKPEQAKLVKFASARASFSQGNFPVANLLNTDNTAKGGWAINPKFHESHWAVLETTEPLGFAEGTVLKFKLEQDFGASRTIGRLRLSAITGNVSGQALPAELTDALARPDAKRTAKQKKTLTDYRLRQSPEFAKLEKEKTRLEAQLRKLAAPTTLVMQETTPRMSTIFQRGEFRTPGDKVGPTVPVVLHSLKSAAKETPTRLDLAQWLVSRENPLVARVVVNRWWAELFGHGLVATPEDFGIKGETPTHPELLDWLAVEFMDNGWSMKKLLKTIVMSATYRQSSRVTPESFARDDQNLLYARGPRHRLDAETIRDNALAIAGLLSLKQGGAPIKPYQPDGLWVKVGGQRYDYEVSPGEEKYRRGIYVVWKRGAPYPSFVNFDANARLACRVKRPRSNTPLQALTLMNDPVYVEAAMAFAKRVLTEKPAANTDERIAHAFRLATGRAPTSAEIATLSYLLSAERMARTADAKTAKDFVGKFALPPGVTAEEFAAWYAIATALLNLDETISKG
ncbi:MAG: PSD1 domain-containing protein [Verrucomicrobia bacterium]|nr:PSD1 domain-containing protein [Verrucomicrobiota bacterium]